MISMKSVLVVALIALGVAQVANCCDDCDDSDINDVMQIQLICGMIGQEMPEESKSDSRKAMSFFEQWIQNHPNNTRTREYGMILDSWQEMLSGSCSESSLRSMSTMSLCKDEAKEMEGIAKPLQAYADKCLSADLINKQLVQMYESLDKNNRLDLIDTQFINKFLQEHPEMGPIQIDGMNVDPLKSANALVDAVNRDFAKAGKDASTEFQKDKWEQNVYRKYMEQRVNSACLRYLVKARREVFDTIAVSELWQGGQKAMIASLDQEPQAILFRYNFCGMLDEKPHMEVYDFFYNLKTRFGLPLGWYTIVN